MRITLESEKCPALPGGYDHYVHVHLNRLKLKMVLVSVSYIPICTCDHHACILISFHMTLSVFCLHTFNYNNNEMVQLVELLDPALDSFLDSQ